MSDAHSILDCLHYIQSLDKPHVIVVSALFGLTDRLLAGAHAACQLGQIELAHEIAEELQNRHEKIFSDFQVDIPESFQKHLKTSCQNYRDLCHGLSILQEFTKRSHDHVVAHGERTSAQLLTNLLNAKNINASTIDATEIIHVQTSAIGSTPIEHLCKKHVKEKLIPLVKKGHVIIPGFIAWDPSNQSLLTLGRGGSDFSATILGQALKSEKVTLCKDVDGILTADPKRVPQAGLISKLHFREASELAYYGAGVLHPRTMIPLMKSDIPLEIRNFHKIEDPGTIINQELDKNAPIVRALTAITNQTMINIEGYGLTGVPGIASKAFQCLAEHNISITLISQASSENSICMTINSHQKKKAVELLQNAFALELQQGLIHDISSLPNLSTLAIVGLGMHGKAGVASQCLKSIADKGINIHGLAQGSSELNISIVIAEKDTDHALRALHKSFQLGFDGAQDSQEESTISKHLDSKFAVKILGFGHVGQALARRISDANQKELQLSSVADSKCCVGIPSTRPDETLDFLIQQKRTSNSLKPSQHSIDPENVLIDCTATNTSKDIMTALKSGQHVILANKIPLSSSQSLWDEIKNAAITKDLYLGYEATVGAGLPVIRTINSILAGNDSIISIYGSFSGSLGSIFSSISDGIEFSQAVRHAYEEGFTEPDLREDLSAHDILRKCLILARTMGIQIEPSDVHLEPVCEVPSITDPTRVLLELEKMDDDIRDRMNSCAKRGFVLRYTASVSQDGVHIGLEEVEQDSPIGLLRGSSNIFIIETKFQSRPIIISGPGAGIQETTSGLYADIFSLIEAHLEYH